MYQVLSDEAVTRFFRKFEDAAGKSEKNRIDIHFASSVSMCSRVKQYIILIEFQLKTYEQVD